MEDEQAVVKATFADFAAQTYDFDIETPDGSVLGVTMRALTSSQRADVERSLPARPTAPVKAFKKAVGAEVPDPIYDYEDKGYLLALADWARVRMCSYILAALVEPTIPGADTNEQIVALGKLGSWALDALWRAASILITVGDENVRHRPFHGGRNEDTPAV